MIMGGGSNQGQRLTTADKGWLYNDSAPDQLLCSSVGIALHYVYARRN